MTKQTKSKDSEFFTKELADRYDEANRKLAPISENLHLLINLILDNLPAKAKILSVGAGTGAEILSLTRKHPEWTFVAVEPSLPMLEVCQKKLEFAGLSDRCELVHGYATDLPNHAQFDAALAVLVAHFIPKDERLNFYKSLVDRIKTKGFLVNAEISYNLASLEFSSMINNWKSIQRLMGASDESLEQLPQQLREMLSALSPEETEDIIRKSGIILPVRFFQALMVSAWYGVKA